MEAVGHVLLLLVIRLIDKIRLVHDNDLSPAQHRAHQRQQLPLTDTNVLAIAAYRGIEPTLPRAFQRPRQLGGFECGPDIGILVLADRIQVETQRAAGQGWFH
ncbi:hypothetical protein BGZ93_010114 [Podila epicladia]|nr:hypothetical protein BGZ92_009508 [Podila epicladia]KAG0098859.1 hypothetical protein BGZ93_010114 [Podila epicladia]